MSASSGTTTYRLDVAVALRVIGPLFVVVGVGWVLLTSLVGGRGVLAVMAFVTLALTVGSAFAALRPPRVLTLTSHGFGVSLVRGAGATAGSWSEVESVDARVAGGAPAVVLTLTEGRSTAIPLSLLGRRHVEAQREIHDRLNAAHGYRHLEAP